MSWLTTVLVLLVCFDVVRRYLFKSSAAWVIEMEWHLFAVIFLLGAGYTLKHQKHVRVDLFYEKFDMVDRASVNFIGSLCFLVPWCLVMIWVSTQYAYQSFLLNEGSPDPGGLPARYVIKFFIPLGLFLLFLQAIAEAIRAYKVIKS